MIRTNSGFKAPVTQFFFGIFGGFLNFISGVCRFSPFWHTSSALSGLPEDTQRQLFFPTDKHLDPRPEAGRIHLETPPALI